MFACRNWVFVKKITSLYVLKGHACYAVFTVKQTDVANTKCQSITVQAIISYYEYNFILKQSCINVLNVGPYFSLFWTLWRTISQKFKKNTSNCIQNSHLFVTYINVIPKYGLICSV